MAKPISVSSAVVRSSIGRSSAKTDRQLHQFAVDAARLLHDLHCEDVLVLDVRKQSELTDYIVLGTGTSDRQIRSLAEQVQEMAKDKGIFSFGSDADAKAAWVVLDFADIVVHLFDPHARAHYDLEMLWGDAPRIRWRRTATAGRKTKVAKAAGTAAADRKPRKKA